MIAHRVGLLLVVMFCAALPAMADDAEIKKTAKAKASECQESLLKGDYDTFISLTHPKVVEGSGGQKKMIEKLNTGMKEMKDKGFVFKSVKTSEPSDPLAVGKELYLTVPYALEVTAPNGRFTMNSALVGISSDNGKSWVFADAGPGRDTLKKVFPNLPEKLPIPKKELTPIKD